MPRNSKTLGVLIAEINKGLDRFKASVCKKMSVFTEYLKTNAQRRVRNESGLFYYSQFVGQHVERHLKRRSKRLKRAGAAYALSGFDLVDEWRAKV